jgi:hypothetical protein
MSDFQHNLPEGQEHYLPQGPEGPRARDDLYRQPPVKGR